MFDHTSYIGDNLGKNHSQGGDSELPLSQYLQQRIVKYKQSDKTNKDTDFLGATTHGRANEWQIKVNE